MYGGKKFYRTNHQNFLLHPTTQQLSTASHYPSTPPFIHPTIHIHPPFIHPTIHPHTIHLPYQLRFIGQMLKLLVWNNERFGQQVRTLYFIHPLSAYPPTHCLHTHPPIVCTPTHPLSAYPPTHCLHTHPPTCKPTTQLKSFSIPQLHSNSQSHSLNLTQNRQPGTQVQKHIKELVGHEMNPLLHPILFDQIKLFVDKFFDSSGQVPGFWWLFGGFLVAFWWVFGGFLVAFWWLFGGFLVAFWWLFGGFLVAF